MCSVVVGVLLVGSVAGGWEVAEVELLVHVLA
jgi:hypothetical protein